MIGMTHERGTTASYDLALYLAAQNARREGQKRAGEQGTVLNCVLP